MNEQEQYAQYVKDHEDYQNYVTSQANKSTLANVGNLMLPTGQSATEYLNPKPEINAAGVINEMPPELKNITGFATRAGYKNLGTDTAESFNWMQKRHPDIQFSKEPETGDVLAKSRNDGKTYRLDPKGFDWQDITDVAYDIPSGMIQGGLSGAAGLAAGVATGAGTGGALAVPATMLAASGTSAALGAGSEALRQKLGGLMGINPPNVNMDEVKGAALLGGAVPVLFGSGAGARQALPYAEKLLAKRTATEGLTNAQLSPEFKSMIINNIPNSTADELASKIAQTQKGIAQKGYDVFTDKVAPKIGELASGIGKPIIDRAKEILPQIRAFEKDPNVVIEKVQQLGNGIVDSIHTETKVNGQKIGGVLKVMDQQGEVIPTKDILQPIYDLKTQLAEGGNLSDSDHAVLKELDDVVTHHLAVDKTQKTFVPGQWTTPTAGNPPEYIKEHWITSGTHEVPEYVDASKMQNFKHKLNDIASSYGFNIGAADTAQGAMGGIPKVVDSRIAGTFSVAAQNAKDSLETLAGKMDPALQKTFMDLNENHAFLKDTAKEFQKHTKSDQALERLLTKAASNDPYAIQLIKTAGELTRMDIPNEALTIKAIRTFSNPSKDMQSFSGTTSTSRTVPMALAGGMLGYAAGQASGGAISPFLMGAVGTTLGAKAGAPAALRRYMDIGDIVRNLGPKAINIPYSPMLEQALPKVVPRPGDILSSTPYMLMQSAGQSR